MFKAKGYEDFEAQSIKTLVLDVFNEKDVILLNEDVEYKGVDFLESSFKDELDKPFDKYLLELDYLRNELKLRILGRKVDYFAQHGQENEKQKTIQQAKDITNQQIELKRKINVR